MLPRNLTAPSEPCSVSDPDALGPGVQPRVCILGGDSGNRDANVNVGICESKRAGVDFTFLSISDESWCLRLSIHGVVWSSNLSEVVP